MASPHSWVIDPNKEPEQYDHWPKHPEWRGHYSFLTATPPALASTYHTNSTTYSASVIPFQRYHFEEFHWGKDRSQTTTRTELEDALHNVLALYDIVADVYLTGALIRCANWCHYPDEDFKQEFDRVLFRIHLYLRVLHAVAGMLRLEYLTEKGRSTKQSRACCHRSARPLWA